MKMPAVAAQKFRIALLSKSCRYRKEGPLTDLCEMINYSLKTYAADDFIAEMDAKTLQLTKSSNMTPTDYGEAA